MAERITIMLDEDLKKKLRLKQAKLIQQTKKSVSLSFVINHVLDGGLKNGKKI